MANAVGYTCATPVKAPAHPTRRLAIEHAMDYRITQCPRCGTSFRVTDAHLAVAAGAVRCGSCLHIFNAREHWAEENSSEDDEQEAMLREDQALERSAQAASAPSENVADHDHERLISDEDDDEPLFGDDPAEHERPFFTSDDDRLLFGEQRDTTLPLADDGALSPDFLDSSGWSPEAKPQFGSDLPGGDNGDDSEQDDSWAEQLLMEDDGLPPPPQQDPLLDDILASTPIADENDSDDWQYNLTGNGATADDAARPPSDDLLLSADFLALGEISRSTTGDSTGIADGAGLSPEWQRVLGGAGQPDSLTGSKNSDAPLHAGERIGDNGGKGSNVGNGGSRGRHLLGSFEPEPLQLHRFVREPRWPKVLWGLGLVAGLLLLAGQYLYFNFPTLARGDSRPLMAQLCGVIGCTLPPQHDLTAIRTSSLIVRSHPSRRGALAVDAILTNTAPFRQPYPNLLLQFTDINGEAVAGSIISAEQYLGGEQAGEAFMPVQQPVHIGLAIADPGNRAVNYQLSVSPPDTP